MALEQIWAWTSITSCPLCGGTGKRILDTVDLTPLSEHMPFHIGQMCTCVNYRQVSGDGVSIEPDITVLWWWASDSDYYECSKWYNAELY